MGLCYYDSYNIFITKYLRNKLSSLTPLTKLQVNAATKMCDGGDGAGEHDDTSNSNSK